MPDSRTHRGPHPEDHRLFGAQALPSLRAATRDLSWLMGRGYAPPSAVKLVGDRYQLAERQRRAVLRCACPDERAALRCARRSEPEQLRGQSLCIDGFNVLTTLEVALSGGVLLIGRDGAMRDVAGVHGSYRSVEETSGALEALASWTTEWGVAACDFYFDQPVSNSGRLRARVLETASARALPWHAHVVPNPDTVLMRCTTALVASADAQILDAEVRWFNLAREIVARALPTANIIDLSACQPGDPG